MVIEFSSHRDVPLFEEMTSEQVADAIARRAQVILPAGATEQHGPHLPLGTDTFQGIEVARRAIFLLAREGVPAIMGPVIPFGPPQFLTESPRPFPGTVNVSNNTLRALTYDLCRELAGQGFRTIFLLCANAESEPVLQIVAKEVSETTPASVLTLQWLVGIQPGYKGLMRSERPQGHAGEGETARILASSPHLVHMDKAYSYHPRVPAETAPNNKMPYLGGAIGRYKYPDHVFDGYEHGTWGDPQNATAEVGEKSYQIISEWVCAAVRAEWRLWNA